MLQTGCYDIVIGRDDGGLEVWDVDEQGVPYRVYSTSLHESITAVAGGYVTSPTTQDILVHTFTGKVCALGCGWCVAGAAEDWEGLHQGLLATPLDTLIDKRVYARQRAELASTGAECCQMT
jgi:hypothetical protein